MWQLGRLRIGNTHSCNHHLKWSFLLDHSLRRENIRRMFVVIVINNVGLLNMKIYAFLVMCQMFHKQMTSYCMHLWKKSLDVVTVALGRRICGVCGSRIYASYLRNLSFLLVLTNSARILFDWNAWILIDIFILSVCVISLVMLMTTFLNYWFFEVAVINLNLCSGKSMLEMVLTFDQVKQKFTLPPPRF